jgi:hypothetical protein
MNATNIYRLVKRLMPWPSAYLGGGLEKGTVAMERTGKSLRFHLEKFGWILKSLRRVFLKESLK